jgi:serine phosphatase RsbU (regulator of sigma subunit)
VPGAGGAVADPAGRALTVLLVEDDDGDALIVEEELELSGADVALERRRTLAEAVGSGLAGFDCALLDLNLPDAEGLDGLRRLRALAPDLAVLVLTGLDDERRGVEAVAAGAQDYLVKGSTSGVLLARSLRYAVERRRAEQTQQQLSIAQLEARENARLERGLLPAPLVSDPALTLATHYRPGRRRALLGGDFFDAVERPDGTVHAVIGDVCGHGPDEAALGVCLRIAWRTLVLAGYEPTHVLAALDDVLLHERSEPGIFVTLCDVAISPDRRTLRLAVAGHPGPLLLHPELREVPFTARGPALGLIPHAHWPVETIELPPEWALLLYTDGLVEGRVTDSPDRLGTEGLLRLLEPLREAADLQSVAENIIADAEALHGGPLPDDVALLLLSNDPIDEPSAS